MKKCLANLCSLICCLAMSSCGDVSFDNTLPHEEIIVSLDYGNVIQNQATISYSKNLDLAQNNFYSTQNYRKIKNLVGGDLLKVYFSDESKTSVDHVLVDEAETLSMLRVTNAIIPGEIEKNMDIIHEDSSVIIEHTNISYVIDEDGSFTELCTLPMWENLYGTFQSDAVELIDSKENGDKVYRYHLIAVYSYLPR